MPCRCLPGYYDPYYVYRCAAPGYVLIIPPPEATTAQTRPAPATPSPNECYGPKVDQRGNLIHENGNMVPDFSKPVPCPSRSAPRPPSPPPIPKAVLEPIYFDLDQSVLRPDATETLRKDSEWFTQNPGKKVRIQGNCDPRATGEYNLALVRDGQKQRRGTLLILAWTEGCLRRSVTEKIGQAVKQKTNRAGQGKGG